MRSILEKQYECVCYDPATGLTSDELKQMLEKRIAENPEESALAFRSWMLNLICTRARIAVDPGNPFKNKIDHGDLLGKLRWHVGKRVWRQEFGDDNGISFVDMEHACHYCVDTSHTCPDWKTILACGFKGLRDRAFNAGDSEFRRAVVLVYDGAITLCRRFAELTGDTDYSFLAENPPQTLTQAFKLAALYHDLQEIEGEEVRTMGHFDRLYIDFYRNDIAAGRLSRESAKELLKYFWTVFYAKYQGKRFGKNFCFGPEINEFSELCFEAYYELNTVDPKFTVLIDERTPDSFITKMAECIRDGRTAVVSLNYPMIVRSLIRHGRTPEDAAEAIPVGCYEPAVAGKEVSCSGATHLYLPQIVSLVMRENKAGFESFAAFKQACFERTAKEIAYMEEQQRRCEKIWFDISPAPLFSGTYQSCIEKNLDISQGGAVYNSTACVVSYMPNMVDSLAAVEYLVYDKKLCSWEQLRNAVLNNWNGFDELRFAAIEKAPKWGNNDDRADKLAVELTDFIAPLIDEAPNERGGKFYASLYGQMVVERGAIIGALPDGRLSGTPVAKNLDACIGMDRNGVTALLHSVCKLDLEAFPCGTCTDLMLHPTAVIGHEGVVAIAGLIRTFIRKGGSGLQFNIFDVEVLRDAQKNPEKYQNLQVRVCGWNVRFTDLTPEAQQTFIDQAESIA